MLKTLLKKKYLRRISGVKHEKFEKCVSKLKPAWRAAQMRKRVIGRPYGIGDLREHLLLLLMYYRTYTPHLFFAQIFKVDESNKLPSDKAYCTASFWMSFVKDLTNSCKTFCLFGATRPKPPAGVSPPASAKLLYELQYDCNL